MFSASQQGKHLIDGYIAFLLLVFFSSKALFAKQQYRL